MTTIAVINQSSVVQDQDAIAFAAAIEKDLVDSDFTLEYDTEPVNVYLLANGAPLPAGAWPHYLLDRSDVPGDLAYHDMTSADVPEMKTFCLDAQTDGEPWQVAASHEIKEALADPQCTKTGPDGITAYEVCDPVEMNLYYVSGVPITNHVLRAWFVSGAPGPYDAMKVLSGPLSLARGGYKSELQNGQWNEVQGMRADGSETWHRAHMRHGTSRLLKRRCAAGMR